MKYTKLLYVLIGKRIHQLRTINKYSLYNEKFKGLDPSTLAKIEKGLANKKHNPYLLSCSQIIILAEAFNLTCSELIWGTDEDRELYVKLLTISTLINNTDSAFENYTDIEEWIKHTWRYLGESILEQRINQKDFILSEYGFFANSDNYTYYSLLEPEYSSNLETISNLLLHILVSDVDFSSNFFTHLINSSEHMETTLKDYITYKGNYSLLLLDNKNIGYPKFIVAFNKLWDYIKDDYMNFFSNNLFLNDDELKATGISTITNSFISYLLSSSELESLTRDLQLLLEYTDTNAIIASHNMRMEITAAIQMEKFNEKIDPVLIDFYHSTPIYDKRRYKDLTTSFSL